MRILRTGAEIFCALSNIAAICVKSALAHRAGPAPQAELAVASRNADFHLPTERAMSRHASAVTKGQLIEQFHAVVTETEQLLKSVVTAGGEQAGALRSGAEQSLAKAKDRLRELEQAAADQVEAVSKSTDAYVHKYPWQSIGVAAGVTVVAGVVIGLMLNRH